MAEIGKNLAKVKALLMAGKPVAIPTETVYGLAANALDPDAVLTIFAVKKRPAFDPLILHIPSIQQVEKYAAHIPEKARKLANTFWPGPVTLILKKKSIIPDVVTSGLDTVAIRCPRHPLTSTLLAQLPFPLAAPSANPFGYISPTSPEHVATQLGNRIAYILDGDISSIGIESTIVGFEGKYPVLHRQGGVSQEEIERVIGPVNSEKNDTPTPMAPGSLKSHYAPYKTLIVGDITRMMQRFSPRNIGVLCFQRPVSSTLPKNTLILSPTGSLQEAAKNLFSSLHRLDQMDVQVILAERVPDKGLGRAINDRLERAATTGYHKSDE